jgi:hypothetical protein
MDMLFQKLFFPHSYRLAFIQPNDETQGTTARGNVLRLPFLFQMPVFERYTFTVKGQDRLSEGANSS